jgi:hypothetical protein
VILEKSKVEIVATGAGARVHVRPPSREHAARDTRAEPAGEVRMPLHVTAVVLVAAVAVNSRQTAYT